MTALASASSIALPAQALAALRALEDAGFESWIVGGFLRDALLGREAADVDIASQAHWTEAQRVFEARGWHTHETGVAHGTLTVIVEGLGIEVTTFRADGSYDDARRPREVSFVSSIEEDLGRRDFTMNAIAYHPDRGFVDPYGGMEDMECGLIRAVGDPNKRFSEDALRTLRACRFVSQLGFSIDETTYRGMYENKGLLGLISRERIRHELYCLMVGEHAGKAIVETVDVLSAVLPELVAMKGFEQHTPYHIYDVLGHTARVVDGVPAVSIVRWAALFHDMGKPATFFTRSDGVGHFYGHPQLSAQMASGIMGRFGMSQQFAKRVVLLVEHHDNRISPSRRSVKRLLARMGGDAELTRMLFALQRADALAQAPRCAERTQVIDELERILDEVLADGDAFAIKDLAIDGDAVMALGVPEGPRVGEALQATLDAVIDGETPNEPEACAAFVREWLGE